MFNNCVCQECDRHFKTFHSLLRHIRIHKISSQIYVLKWKYNNNVPKCKCGCGSQTKFNNKKKDFNTYVHHHQTKDIELRKLMIEKGRTVINNVEVSQKISAKLKTCWREKTFIEKHKQMRVDKNSHWNVSRNESLQHYWKNILPQQASLHCKMMWETKGDTLREMMSSPEFATKVSLGTKVGLSSPKTREKLSLNAAQKQANGIIAQNRTKRSWIFNIFTQQYEHIDSNWEREFIVESMKRNIPFKRNVNTFIKYQSVDGKQKRYVPDFISLNEKMIVEIKGMKTQNDILKCEAAKQYCDDHNLLFLLVDNFKQISSQSLWDKLSSCQ